MIKKNSALVISLIASSMIFSLQVAAAQRVSGYTKKNGTYVSSHHRTSPNSTQRDNWTSKGNANPYTGKSGTRTPRK